jgi:dephospho-CoA kinase
VRIVGLTGGIASGKSTVSRLFAELGAAVIDADQTARQVTEPGQPAIDEIRQAFGDSVIDKQGGLDRAAMRAVVFPDPKKLKKLESILHPKIYVAIGEWLRDAMEEGRKIAIIEATLIIEAPPPMPLDKLIVVTCDTDIRIARTKARDGFDEAHIRQVMANQLTDVERITHADYVIENDGDLKDTVVQIEKTWADLLAEPLDS